MYLPLTSTRCTSFGGMPKGSMIWLMLVSCATSSVTWLLRRASAGK
jgi:hypothetical protein